MASKFLAVLLVFVVFGENSYSIYLPTFIWSPRNPMFKKLENCSDEYLHMSVDFDSQMYILCPSIMVSTSITKHSVPKTVMYENMYVVTKEEFDECRVGELTKNTRKLLTCDNPKNPNFVKSINIHFASLVATNYNMPFYKHRTYYFIATSNGTKSGLNRRENGRCKTHRMKMAITICDLDSNCYSRTPKCQNPVVNEIITQPPTVPKNDDTKGVKTFNVIAPNVPLSNKVTAQMRTDDDDVTSSSTTLLLVCLVAGLIGGILIGIGLVLASQKFMKRKAEKSAIKESAEVFTVEEQVDAMETLRREANRKYFSDQNAEYRNSTEFKRLLSTSSGTSSERYSGIKLEV